MPLNFISITLSSPIIKSCSHVVTTPAASLVCRRCRCFANIVRWYPHKGGIACHYGLTSGRSGILVLCRSFHCRNRLLVDVPAVAFNVAGALQVSGLTLLHALGGSVAHVGTHWRECRGVGFRSRSCPLRGRDTDCRSRRSGERLREADIRLRSVSVGRDNLGEGGRGRRRWWRR